MHSLLNKIILAIIIPVLLLVISCNQEIKPEGVLNESKLSEILVDVHLAEASIQLINTADRDSIARGYYGHIFRIHEVKEAEFYASMEYYSANSKMMADIYTKTEEILKSKSTGGNKKAESEEKKK